MPDVEKILYRIFFSPMSTFEERREKDKEDLLVGNLFDQSLHEDIYKNLIKTMAFSPKKKKHYKKIIKYIRKHEDPQSVSPELIEFVVKLGMFHEYPITLGQTMRDFIVDGDYNIHKNTFIDFVLFMERCKGFEDDARKFLMLTQASSHLQINYELIRPLLLRIIKNRGGQETIKFFEQLRKNIQLNKSWKSRTIEERAVELRRIRKEFFDGLIQDLMANRSYQLSEIVMAEKLKEKFDITKNDEIMSLKIYSAQLKFDEYKEKFDLFINATDGEYKPDVEVCRELSSTLMLFDTDKFKEDRQAMTEQLNEVMRNGLIVYEGDILQNIIYVYTES